MTKIFVMLRRIWNAFARAVVKTWRLPHAPLVLALVPALYVCWPILVEKPLSRDHAAHLFKAWHLWTEMIPTGRLRGWSHFWGFGFPSDELVPMGSEVWVALFRVATLGQLSWLTTYALSFAGLMMLKTLAAFLFTRRFFGSAAAVIAAWITVLDPGAMLEGGWNWHSYWGVWPVTLGVSLVQFSLLELDRTLAFGRMRDALGCGGFLALALLTHPMALVATAVAAPLLILDHWFRRRSLSAQPLAAALGALALGVALASFFLIPFLTRTDQTQDLGWLGYSLEEASRRFVTFQTFQAVWIPIQGLSIAGAWFALRSRRPGHLFVVSAAGAFVFLGTDVLVNELHLERLMPTLIKLEVNRMLLVAKLFWFPLAGHAVVTLASRGWNTRSAHEGDASAKVVRGVLGVALVAALLVPGYEHFYNTQIKKEIEGESTHENWSDILRFFDWSREERKRTREFYRIAYHMWRGNHISTLAPVYNQTPIYKVGYTPAQIFNKFPMTDEPPLFQALSVKYVMSFYPLTRSDLKLERRFGALYVYRHLNYRPEPFTVLDGGVGELLEFGPERLRVRLEGVGEHSRVKIHIASYPRWRASIDGEPVPIRTVPIYGAEYPILMEVPAKNGVLTLEYVYLPADWWGLFVTLLALPAFAAAWWFGRRSARLERVWKFCDFHRRRIAIGVVVTALVGVVLAIVLARLRSTPLPQKSFFHAPNLSASMGSVPCQRTHPLAYRCGSEVVEARVVSGVWGVHLCMSSPRAPQTPPITFKGQAKLGSFLRGQYDPSKEGQGSIQVRIDGKPFGQVRTRPAFLRHEHIQFDTRKRVGQTVNLELELAGAALYCFDFELVP